MPATRSRGRTEPTPKPKNDAYVGLLAISLLALIGASVLLYLDYEEYGAQTAPPAPSLTPQTQAPGGGAPQAPADDFDDDPADDIGLNRPGTPEPALARDVNPESVVETVLITVPAGDEDIVSPSVPLID